MPLLGLITMLALSSVLSGIVSASLPTPIVLAVVGGGIGIAGVGAAGGLVNARRLHAPGPAQAARTVDAADGFRMARLLFYLGVASLGQLTLRPALATTASDFLFLGALLAILVTPRKTIPLSHGWSPLLLVGTSMVAFGSALSMFGAEHRAAGALVTVKFVYLTAIWFWLAAQLLVTRAHVRIATSCWVASIAVSGVVALVQFFTGSWLPTAASAWTRMPGTGQHVNDLGGMAAVALVPALVLTGAGLRGAVRLTAGGAIFAGLLLSGAVAGMLAAIMALFAWVALAGAYGRALLVVIVLLTGGIVLYGTTPDAEVPTPLARLHEVTGARGDPRSTAWSRLETFEAAIGRIAKNPILGTGMSAEDAVTSTGYVVHNIVLGPFDRAGAFGFLGMLLILGATGRSAVFAVREATTAEEYGIAAALLSAFVAFLVFGMAAPILFQRYGWVAAALLHANYWRLKSGRDVATADLGEEGCRETDGRLLEQHSGALHGGAVQRLAGTIACATAIDHMSAP